MLSTRFPLLLVFALSCTAAGAQEVFLVPPDLTPWHYSATVGILDTAHTTCVGQFAVRQVSDKTIKAYFISDRTENDPTCKREAVPIRVSASFSTYPPGNWRVEYYRPYATEPVVTKAFGIDTTSITRDTPIEISPAAPTTADVIRVRFRVYDSPCENLFGFAEGVELPSGDVNLRFSYPVIVPLCPGAPPPWEYSIPPRAAGTFQIGIVDSRTGSAGRGQKTVSVTDSSGDNLPNVRDGTVNMSDLWQARGESGWGVTITQHGAAPARVFAVIYRYESKRGNANSIDPHWFAVTGGTWVRKNVLKGTLYRTTGSSANAVQALAASTSNTEVGTALLEFTSPTSMRLHLNWKAVLDQATFLLPSQSSFMATMDRLLF